MRATYHNHSIWSDGKGTVAEMAAAALAAGFDEIGTSDHFGLFPGDRFEDWCMQPEALPRYVAEVLELKATLTSPIVKLGLECDWVPERMDDLAEAIAPYPWDYLIGSVHFVGPFPLDASPVHWKALDMDAINGYWEEFWGMERDMAASGVFDIAGHLDLPKKYGNRPSVDFTHLVEETLDAMADTGMALEINVAGWSLPAQEAYPSPRILRMAFERGIPLTINADAHRPEHLGRDQQRAEALAAEVGYTHLARYDQRERSLYPLD